MVPSFHCTFLPGMPSSPTPGSPTSICSRTSMPTWPSPFDHRLGTPDTPAIRSTRASPFRGFTGSLPLRPARLLAPLHGSDWFAQPSGTFTSRLSTDQSPSPLLDITTTVAGSPSVGGTCTRWNGSQLRCTVKRRKAQCEHKVSAVQPNNGHKATGVDICRTGCVSRPLRPVGPPASGKLSPISTRRRLFHAALGLLGMR